MNLQVTKKQIEWLKLQEKLELKIDEWWNDNCEDADFPIIGHEVTSIMASSAINTLLAIKSTYDVLESDGFINPNDG